MAFWLCDERRGQETSWLQRFDPRFWTIDFPRPMMASATAPAPDTLRIECEFHNTGELAGVIWDSEDRLDHPLLAYQTSRDYAHTILSFRYRSSGLVPLDQPNGPTLTIEGRDTAGNPKSWFVRLWNYATGTPQDAQVHLPFSALQGGWELQGDPVNAADIDRMFISLVPPGYVPDGNDPLPQRANGWAELTDIRCEGHHAMLEIGDVLLPAHGIRMATAYDDAYNQTPERLVRNIRGLGYRDRIVHYLGMSHFFRLDRSGVGLLVASDGALCGPARAWHESYFQRCTEHGFEVVASLSYELFAEHCPPAWQQLAHDGEPARTGWEPPSALLSPANGQAMDWLQSVARAFVALMKGAGLPVLFQVGEPWWWVTPDDRKICLYDEAARSALGGNPVAITDMRAPLSDEQASLLDAAGTILAQSTARLADAVRASAAPASAELLLLTFTPTILAADMPGMKRANLPTGWAFPAFDRLQVEDYDWLTAGAEGLRRAAYREVNARLGYPTDRQDYFAGFVLSGDDAEVYWPRIDAALDEARDRCIEHLYVWALPQVCRDGYCRLPSIEDNAMQAFDEVAYPLALGRDTGVSPEFSTSVSVTASGHERRNTHWSDARLRFDVGPGIRSEKELRTLIAFFRGRRGAARGFLLTDPWDHSSNEMTGTPTMLDQKLGLGDGLATSFQLIKHYGGGSDPQTRPITRPRAGSILVSVDGVATDQWSLWEKGTIMLDSAPPEGAVVRAGFLFDVPVRFAEDRLDINGVNFEAGEAPSVPLVEIREAV